MASVRITEATRQAIKHNVYELTSRLFTHKAVAANEAYAAALGMSVKQAVVDFIELLIPEDKLDAWFQTSRVAEHLRDLDMELYKRVYKNEHKADINLWFHRIGIENGIIGMEDGFGVNKSRLTIRAQGIQGAAEFFITSGGGTVKFDFPHTKEFLKLQYDTYKAHQEVICCRRAVARVLAYHSTLGQVRRDWPGLVYFATEEDQHKLGQTVAKGPVDLNAVGLEIRDLHDTLLTTAQMLPPLSVDTVPWAILPFKPGYA